MMRGKRVLAVVLVFCMVMVLGDCPVGKEKVQAAVSGDYEYEILEDGMVEIIKYNGSDSMLTIPETIDSKRVTSIGNRAFASCRSLREINLPSGLLSIGGWAFSSCDHLKKINLPSGLLSIGCAAFDYCYDLQEINLPSGLTKMEGWTFHGCESLREISLPSRLTNIGDKEFDDCISLEEIFLPSGVTSIGESAFCNCINLKKIYFPSGLNSIGDEAFFYCNSLESVYYSGSEEQWNNIQIGSVNNGVLQDAIIYYNSVPENDSGNLYVYTEKSDGTIEITKYIGSDTEIEVPAEIDGKRVTRIGNGAFYDLRNLTKISLPNSVVSIGDSAFDGCEGLTDIQLSENLTSIEASAFAGCSGLTEISIPDGLERIEESVFGYCTSLKEIDLPDNISSIGRAAFISCTGLTKINIPDGCTSITNAAFRECAGLTEINLPVSIVSIGESAFLNCSSLEDVHYSGTEEQWNGIEIETVGNENLLNAQKYFIEGDYEYKILDNGTVEITEYTEYKEIEDKVSIPAVIAGKKVTSIGFGSFAQHAMISEVEIPDGVTRIEDKAFYWSTKIKKIIIPDSVDNIGSNAFQMCIALKEIILPVNIAEIGDMMFDGDGSLQSVHISGGVTSIGEEAFRECFDLKDVYYSGTEEQWKEIEILEGNEHLFKATIHYKQVDPQPPQEEEVLPAAVDVRQELERLKSGDSFLLNQDFQHYLSDEQIDIMESYLYTWLAEINYTYQYNGISGVRERIMKKAGINPQGDFASGMEQAVTHICVETKYGSKTFEITLDFGIPDHNGNLYPTYSAMHYEILEKESIPSDLPTSGQIGRESYADLGAFAECVKKASEDSLHGTYQWESLDEEMTAGVLVDKAVTEIIGNKNGSFSDAVFTIYAKPLLTYSKKVTIACPVDVHVYSMDGKEAGSIVGNKPEGGNANVRLDVNGDTKTVYLAGNDYYLNLYGTDTGTMRYEVEEIANEEVRRNVQFLELQLEKDMQYEGYVFRPLNIDRDLYALRTVGGSEQKVFHADQDTYQALFRRIQSLSLSQGQTSLDRDKTVQLQASLIPLDASNPNLQWTTDSESVVKVDGSGLVTAVGAGRATVTVSTKDGSFLKQFCVIDVAEKIDIPNENSGGNSSGSSGGSSGWSGSGNVPSVEQEKTPVVVKLHYIFQFHANGGTGLSRRTMTLLADDSPGIMPKVKRKDYIFDGWYTQQDGGEQVTGDKPLKEAATLYARWTKAAAPAKAPAPVLKSAKKGQIQISLKNVTGAAGYQIEYSASKKFTSAKAKDVGASAKKKTISGLKAGQKYYVRIRAYCLDSMKNKIYGAYSMVKSVKI